MVFYNYNEFITSYNRFDYFPEEWERDRPNLKLALNRYARILLDELYEYYSLVFVLLHSHLKATLLNIYLIFDSTEIRKVIRQIKNSRRDGFFLNLYISGMWEFDK